MQAAWSWASAARPVQNKNPASSPGALFIATVMWLVGSRTKGVAQAQLRPAWPGPWAKAQSSGKQGQMEGRWKVMTKNELQKEKVFSKCTRHVPFPGWSQESPGHGGPQNIYSVP